MNSIEAMAADMERQLHDLPALALPEPVPGDARFVGSGDSYVAALAAQYFSSGRAIACRPEDIIADHSLASRNAYFVSVSGKTAANVLAAKAARGAGARTTAITVDRRSPLAQACDNIIELKFKSAGRTAGTIGFTASLLVCARLATGKATCPPSLRSIYDAAAKKSEISGKVKDNTAVLGEALLYPAAMYGALKFGEVLGSRAVAYPLGDFFHSPLFSLKKSDQVVVFGAGEGDARLSRKLARSGFSSLYLDCSAYRGIGSLLYAAFFAQHLVLGIARRKRMTECYFLQDKKLLEVSSDVIYRS